MDRPRVDYDRLAAAYDARYAAEQLAGIGKALADVASRTRAQRVLEVGCGTGRWVAELTTRARFICGADASLGMLSQARAKLATTPLIAARANALPFRSNVFDLVYAVNAIHHFDDPRAFIVDAVRLLTPGGAVAIVGIDPRLICRRYFYEYFEGTYERDLRRFPAVGDLVNWMAAAGLSPIEYRIVERYRQTFRGPAVRSDAFLRKDSNSLLALLTASEYQQGIDRIEAAIGGGNVEFTSDIAFLMVAGWAQANAL
jgi:ubiquinone/menaquinone biosynthesis C-methylase UbiE